MTKMAQYTQEDGALSVVSVEIRREKSKWGLCVDRELDSIALFVSFVTTVNNLM